MTNVQAVQEHLPEGLFKDEELEQILDEIVNAAAPFKRSDSLPEMSADLFNRFDPDIETCRNRFVMVLLESIERDNFSAAKNLSKLVRIADAYYLSELAEFKARADKLSS